MSDILSVKTDFMSTYVRITVGVPAGTGEVHALQAYVSYDFDFARPKAEAFDKAMSAVLSATERHVPPTSARLDRPVLDDG